MIGYNYIMSEQLSVAAENYLNGIEWSEFQTQKATIYQIYHDHIDLSVVYLLSGETLYRVFVDTGGLDINDAEIACKNVAEWWEPSMASDDRAVYDISGQIL